MILIGQLDSPFVRRVAVSLDELGFAFEHWPWSVGKDFDRLRELNPLGRVPTLVLDDRTVVVESSFILDYLDELVGPARALVPASGPARRAALHRIGLAVGAVEKGLQLVGERVFRPADKRHEPYLERCQVQVAGALAALESLLAGDAPRDRLDQVDITLEAVLTYLNEAAGIDLAPYPTLAARHQALAARPAFTRRYQAFIAPVPS